jgi:hypothetical protein
MATENALGFIGIMWDAAEELSVPSLPVLLLRHRVFSCQHGGDELKWRLIVVGSDGNEIT